MKNKVFLLFLLFIQICVSQKGYELVKGYSKAKIQFEQHSNLIIFPIEINNVTFNMILDSGASKTILFNLNGIDSLNLKSGRAINVKGYGKKEDLKAYYSKGNDVRIGKRIINRHAEVIVLSESDINIAPKLDIQVHGLLGVSFFKNFVTHLDYEDLVIHVYRSRKKLPRYLRKAEQYDLLLKSSRPYVNVHMDNNVIQGDYQLLLDTGSGDALWVLDQIDKTFKLANSFEDYLGFGVSGDIVGLRTKINSFSLFSNTISKVSIAYPYKEYLSNKNHNYEFNGSLGGEILRRFDVVLDYPNKKISVLPNRYIDEGFYYNMTGLSLKKGEAELFTQIERNFKDNKGDPSGYGGKSRVQSSVTLISPYPSSVIKYKYIPKIIVDYVRENSPAYNAGIKEGDQIIGINRYDRKKITIARVTDFFYKNPYKKLKIKLLRDDKEYEVEIINIPLVL